MIEAHRRYPIRILAYCTCPTTGISSSGPRPTAQVTDYFRWLAHTHAMRWQGRAPHGGLRSPLPGAIQELPRAERRASVDGLAVRRAECAGGRRGRSERRTGVGADCGRGRNGDRELKAILSPWPVERPADWTKRVNEPLSAKELGRLRLSLERGRPYGSDDWVKRTASELRLEHTVRPEGRPPKLKNEGPL